MVALLIIVLGVALAVVSFALYQRKQRELDAVSEYAFEMLAEEQNLQDGLRELREAEEQAIRKMRSAPGKQGSRP